MPTDKGRKKNILNSYAMKVVYNSIPWNCKIFLRETLFDELQYSNPEKLITIERNGREKEVQIQDVTLYYDWRNMTNDVYHPDTQKN